jgi:Zeta toxin.
MSELQTRTAKAHESEKQTQQPDVFLFVGLKGAGKTYGAERAREQLTDTTLIDFSDVEFSDYVQDSFKWSKDYVENTNYTPQNLVVSGVRSPEEAEAFREAFDNVTTVVIWTLPEIRYNRLTTDMDTFVDRKSRELWDWGCIEFFTDPDQYDYVIPNNYGKDEFVHIIDYLVDGNLERFQTSPFDDSMSKQKVGVSYD